MTPSVTPPEPGTIVLLRVAIEATLAEKATGRGLTLFADAKSTASAEYEIKTLLEGAFKQENVLASVEVMANPDSAVEEDDSLDAEFATDSDPGDEDDEEPCCGLSTDPCSGCPELGPEDQDYISLQLTPAEAAAVRVLTGNVLGGGALRDASNAVYQSLGEFIDRADEYIVGMRSVVAPAVGGDETAFAKVVAAYEQALKKEEAPLKFTYSQAYEPQRRVF